MSAREQAKHRRREAIVAAAARLLQEHGDTGFSMRALAEAAGVSIATPYNLFGSKQAIMLAVLDAGMAHYEARLARLRADELEIFFKAVTVACGFYAEAPRFHREVFCSAYGDGGRDHRGIFGDPRFLFWKNRVAAAVEAGFLDDGIEANAFALALAQQFFVCILEWAYGELGLDELELRVHYGFALLLNGAATARGSERLRPRIPELQARLLDAWRASGAGVERATSVES